MWAGGDFEDGHEARKTGTGGVPQWFPGHDPAWQGSLPDPGNSSSGGRRQSMVSDSGDTGIGTFCSDSMEDDSSSSTTPLSFPAFAHSCPRFDERVVPTVQVAPSQASPLPASLGTPPSSIHAGLWNRTCHVSPSVTSPLGVPGVGDHHRSVRRWSSLTKLSTGPDDGSARTPGCRNYSAAHGSLDRGLLHGSRKQPRFSYEDLRSPLSSCNSTLLSSPATSPGYQYIHGSTTALETDLYLLSALASPDKHGSLHLNYSSLPEAKRPQGLGPSPAHRPDASSPTQSTLRTQKWLTEQMGYRPKAEKGNELGQTTGCGAEDLNGNRLSAWQRGSPQESSPSQVSLPVNMLVKVKEGLLRRKELEIERQKQQILQLHSRIRENELRAQQVIQSHKSLYDEHLNSQDTTIRTPSKQASDRDHRTELLGRKLAVAELEVLHLNEFFTQITQKYTEDIRKLEEKIRTRDRYISSLKKKCQRESDQNQEKQQRIETLEKYLSDLPTLDELHVHAKQGKAVQQRARDLEKALTWLQRSLEEECAAMKDKDVKIELQAKREKELIASVHSLQQKVQQCLDDGVRIPMQDLKRLEVENSELLKNQDHSTRVFKHQKEQIERLTSQLTATSTRLQTQRSLPHRQQAFLLKEPSGTAPAKAFLQGEGSVGRPPRPVEMSEVGQLLKEMSLCLLDLQALCSILGQRAQGKEPNLSLLLGMKSFNISTEESDCKTVAEEELRVKLLEVGQLRRDIDELTRSISGATLSIWMTAMSLSDAGL